MKLYDLILSSTTCNHPDGIPDVLGDAVLVAENNIYRNIRQSVKRLGASFVPAWSEYQMSPLLQIDRIIKDKKIPYIPTLNILKQIEAVRPHLFLVEEIPSTTKSFHFHESCHVLAHDMVNPTLANGERDFALKSLLCESFANATESFATIFDSTSRCTTFSEYNFYFTTSARHKKNATELIHELGMNSVFRIILYSYIYANFLYKMVSYGDFKKNLPRILRGTTVPKKLQKKCYQIFLDGFALNKGFRLKTNPFFLRLAGVDQDFFKLVDFNFQNKIDRSSDLLQIIDDMCDIVEFGPNAKVVIDLEKKTALRKAKKIRLK